MMLKRKIIQLNYTRKNIFIDNESNVGLHDIKYVGPKNGFPVEIYGSNISGDITVGEGCKIWGTMLAGKIEMARFSTISGPQSWVRGFFDGVSLGAFSSVGMNCVLMDYNHKFNVASQAAINYLFFDSAYHNDLRPKGKITIAEDVWIGANTIVLGGGTIGRGAIIGAGSVVTHDIPPYTVFAGNPAKFIKMRFDEATIKALEESQWWSWPVDKIKKNKDFFMIERM